MNKDLRVIEGKRRLFRRASIQYDRVKKRFQKVLEKTETTEEVEKDKVVAVYRLVRNFCICVNTLVMYDSGEDKQVLPPKFAGELKTALGSADVIKSFEAALKAEKAEDSTSHLPPKVDAKVSKAVNDFLEKHDKKEVLDKYESELESMTSKIDAKREELKTKRAEIAKTKPAPEKKTPAAEPKKAKKEKKKGGSSKSTEEQFRDVVSEVGDRVGKIALSKDDFKTYSDVQGELDAFLQEAIHDITQIKNGLKKRWDAIQSGKGSRRRPNTRRNKNRKGKSTADDSKEAGAEGGQQSVFSKAQH